MPKKATLISANEVVEPFMPLVEAVTTLAKEIAETYEKAQYNKKTCGLLVNRVELAERVIKGLMRQKEDNIEQFLNKNYHDYFKRFVSCLKSIRDFCDDISQLSKFKKFSTSSSIKEKFQEVIKELDFCSSNLNLTIPVTTKEQMNKYLTTLHYDMIEMKKFLDKVGGGIASVNSNIEKVINDSIELQIQNEEIIVKMNDDVKEQNDKIIKTLEYGKSLSFTPLNTEIETIYILKKEVDDRNSEIEVIVKGIGPSEIKESPQPVERMGNRVKIRKKIYRETEVACKPISMDNAQRIQKYLAILKKLEACPFIIQFHGLSEINKDNVMVFEWAECGSLRDLYCTYNIEWKAKVSIARNICRGLIFLHTVEILHHDIRCENVLITKSMQPKISNFDFAREFNSETQTVDNFGDIIRWLAPEKLKFIRTRNKDADRYTIRCEIFSFAMLLWELGFQKKPYEKMNMMEILNHVLGGGREEVNVESSSSSIQKEYCEIIKLAWVQEPSLRPGMRLLFNKLQDLYEGHVLRKSHPISQVVEKPQDSGDNIISDIGNLFIKYWQSYYKKDQENTENSEIASTRILDKKKENESETNSQIDLEIPNILNESRSGIDSDILKDKSLEDQRKKEEKRIENRRDVDPTQVNNNANDIPEKFKRKIIDKDKLQPSSGTRNIDTAMLNGTEVVIKEVKNDKKKLTIQKLIEWDDIGIYNHHNIVEFSGINIQEEVISLILPFAIEGNLRYYLRKKELSFDEKIEVAKHITNGITYLHKNNIIHGDLHPKNILMFKGVAKISDLPLPYKKDQDLYFDEHLFEDVGYIDPKSFLDDKFEKNESTDLYCLGSLLWEIMSESIPYSEDVKIYGISQLIDKIKKNNYREKDLVNVPIEYVNLYKLCWNRQSQSINIINDIHKFLNIS